MKVDYIKLGEKISLLRKTQERKLSQEELAHRAGLSRTFMSRIENGSSSVSLESLLSICDVLKTTPDWLLQDSLADGEETEMVTLIETMLADCSKPEMDIILKAVAALKDILRSHLIK